MDKFNRDRIAKFKPIPGCYIMPDIFVCCAVNRCVCCMIKIWVIYAMDWARVSASNRRKTKVLSLPFPSWFPVGAAAVPSLQSGEGKMSWPSPLRMAVKRLLQKCFFFLLRRRGPCHDKYIAMVAVAFSGSVLPLRWRWGRVIIWEWTLQGRQGCWRIELQKNANGGYIS